MPRYLVVYTFDEAIVASYNSLIGALFHGDIFLSEDKTPWGILDMELGRFLTPIDLMLKNLM